VPEDICGHCLKRCTSTGQLNAVLVLRMEEKLVQIGDFGRVLFALTNSAGLNVKELHLLFCWCVHWLGGRFSADGCKLFDTNISIVQVTIVSNVGDVIK